MALVSQKLQVASDGEAVFGGLVGCRSVPTQGDARALVPMTPDRKAEMGVDFRRRMVDTAQTNQCFVVAWPLGHAAEPAAAFGWP